MFTGIVEDLGEVEAVEHLGDFARIHVRSATVTEDARPGDSIAVNGVCLTVTGSSPCSAATGTAPRRPAASPPTSWGRPSTGPASPPSPRAPGSTWSARSAWLTGSAATSSRATSMAPPRSSAATRRSTGKSCAISLPAGLARYVVHKGSIAIDGVSLTVSARRGAHVVRGQPHPRDAQPHDARLHASRASWSTWRSTSWPSTWRSCSGVPGDRLRGAGTSAGPRRRRRHDRRAGTGFRWTTSSGPSRTSRPAALSIVVDDEDRENEGDIIFAAEAGHAGAARLHGPLHQRRDLRAAARPGPGPAEPSADDRAEQRAHAHRLHRHRGRARRRDHRHLGRRPGNDDPAAGRSARPARTTSSGPATSSRSATPKAACWPARGTPRPRWTWPGWPGCARPACSPRSSTTTAP